MQRVFSNPEFRIDIPKSPTSDQAISPDRLELIARRQPLSLNALLAAAKSCSIPKEWRGPALAVTAVTLTGAYLVAAYYLLPHGAEDHRDLRALQEAGLFPVSAPTSMPTWISYDDRTDDQTTVTRTKIWTPRNDLAIAACVIVVCVCVGCCVYAACSSNEHHHYEPVASQASATHVTNVSNYGGGGGVYGTSYPPYPPVYPPVYQPYGAYPYGRQTDVVIIDEHHRGGANYGAVPTQPAHSTSVQETFHNGQLQTKVVKDTRVRESGGGFMSSIFGGSRTVEQKTSVKTEHRTPHVNTGAHPVQSGGGHKTGHTGSGPHKK